VTKISQRTACQIIVVGSRSVLLSSVRAELQQAMYFFFLSLTLALFSSEIELFCDYDSEAKGQQNFPLLEGVRNEEIPMPCLLRRRLLENGHDLRSWEIEKYRPWLLTFEWIRSFSDLKHWCGIGLPRKSPLPATTRYWMFWNLGPTVSTLDFSKVPKEHLILVMWEPPTVQEVLYKPKIHSYFGKIFTWDDDLVDNKKYFKIHYPALKPLIPNLPSFDEKKFCTMICRRLTSHHPKELYSKRKKMIQFFETKPDGEFDLYGHWWKATKYKNYKGSIQDKLETLKHYKFCICYENMRDVKGYITEKIFDCFAAGVVPVYWGASNVTDFIPEKCFIDRRKFCDEEELYCFLKKIPKEDYQTYLDAAQKFLQSDSAKVFTSEAFIHVILPHLVYLK